MCHRYPHRKCCFNRLAQNQGNRETLKKSSFPRKRESRVLILLVFAFDKYDFSESISTSPG